MPTFLVCSCAVRRMVEYLRPRPLLWIAPPFVAGTILGSAHALVWTLVGLFLSVVLATATSWRVGARPLAMMLWALAGLAGGLTRAGLAPRVSPAPYLRDVRLSGTVVSPSSHSEQGPPAPPERLRRREGAPSRTRVVFVVRIHSLEHRGKTLPYLGRVRVQMYGAVPRLWGGEEIEATGHLRPPPIPTNPGQFDKRKWMRRREIGGIVSAKEVRVRSSPTSPSSLLHRLRTRIRDRLSRTSRPDAGAFTSAFLVGDRSRLDRRLTESLQRSGTAHFLAVSGLHVSIVGAAGWILLACLGIGGRMRTALVILLLLAYATLSGFPVSVIRATLMGVVWVGADLVGRRRDSLVALSASAVIVLGADPRQVFEVSFQLSYLAVLGILILLPLFQRFFSPGSGLPSKIVGSLLVSTAAWLATAPLVQTYFHLVTPVVLIANLLLFPLIVAVMAFGSLTLLLPVVALPAGAAYDVLDWVAHRLASLPGSHYFVPAPTAALTMVYYAGLASWALWGRLTSRTPVFFLAPLLLLPLAVPSLVRTRPPGFRLTVFDVGRGCATYGEFPDGRNFLFDAGSLDYRDPGESVIAPALWSQGVTRVDTIFLSHPDRDHINGARTLVERFRIRRIVVSRYFGRRRAGAALLAWARKTGRSVMEVSHDGGAPFLAKGLRLLGPPPFERVRNDPTTNDASLVLRVEFEGRSLLLTGDIEERGVEPLLQEGAHLRADAWVVPHHGKYHRGHRRLLEAIRPRISLVPGREWYGSKHVLRTLREHGPTVVTGTSGMVRIDLSWKGISWKTFRYAPRK